LLRCGSRQYADRQGDDRRGNQCRCRTRRASEGAETSAWWARLAELESLSSGNDARSLQYDAQLSQLQDLDYNRAMSDFARQQLALEAAQKSFLSVSGLSLFKYL
jgi:flagellar hook-associated protein 3 FlgL